MSVVKNQIVRVGVDLSGLVSGFSKAGGATGNFQKKAAKDITSLKSSLSQMKGAYTSISEAAKDIDLTKSVSKQIAETKKELSALEKTAADLEENISFWSDLEPAGMQYNTQALKDTLATVDLQADSVYEKLRKLETVQSLGESVGVKDVTHSSLNKLQMNIASTEDELRRAETAAEGASDATRKLGDSAKNTGGKVKSASSWISSLRKNSKSSALSVSDLARSLRRVGVVAVGIKLAGSVLGEFRSIVTGYISQNETLQSRVDELKNGFGQALAPAINVATNALTKIMPYVLGVSNAIGQLITNLFGSGWTTVAEGASKAAASTKAATSAQNQYNRSLAGFDQITKLSSNNSDKAPSASVAAVDVKIPSWLTDLPAQLKQAFSEGDYKGVGAALAAALSAGISQTNETDGSLGSTIATVIQNGIDAASGFVETLDWAALGTALVTNVGDLIEGIDWSSIPRLTGATIGGALEAGWSIITGAIEESIQEKTEDTGGNMALGVITAFGEAVQDFQNWTSLKIPIREAISAAFGVEDIRKTILEKIKESSEDLSISFRAKMTSWKETLKDKTISFQAKMSTWNDALKDKTVSFQAKLTSWKESFSEKFLELKVWLQKGWTGSLSKLLGIDSISSKLNLKLPKISIDWDSVNVLGKTFSYPKGFSIKWNAKGAILNGAQLFGRVGNTWLGGGEAGREALLPLDRHTGWMDKIADRVAARVPIGGSGEQNLVVYLMLDGKVVTKSVIRNINAQARATGINPLAAYI